MLRISILVKFLVLVKARILLRLMPSFSSPALLGLLQESVRRRWHTDSPGAVRLNSRLFTNIEVLADNFIHAPFNALYHQSMSY